MKKARIPDNEMERLQYLRSLKILDSSEEPYFDDLVRLANQICGTSIAAISLVDDKRQWFKSILGLKAKETSRDVAFCAHTILQNEILIVPDAREDERFQDNPLVIGEPGIRFYAGIPLSSPEGLNFGTLCVIDIKPHFINDSQKSALRVLAQAVSKEMNQRLFQRQKSEIEVRNQNLEHEAVESSKFLTNIAAQVPGIIYQFKLEPDGGVSFPYASKGVEKIFEVSAEAAKTDGKVIFQRVHPEDYQAVMLSIHESAKNLTNWACDFRTVLPGGGVRWMHANSSPEKQSDGSIIWNGFGWDVTDRKNLEYQLQVASKMSTLGEMAAGIAHEINNPLAVILGRAQFTASQISKSPQPLPPEKLIEAFHKIEETTLRIAKIVKGLKSFSRTTGDEKFESTAVSKIVNDSMDLCSERYRQKGVSLIKPEIKDFDFDCRPIQISQVLVVLMNNAFDAIKSQPEPWVAVEVESTNEEAVLRVKDSGLGIPAQIVDQIMNPFFTTKPVGEGTGLGLSIARGIVNEHGGNLRYVHESKNTCFEVRIPLKHTGLMEQSEAVLPPTQLLKKAV